MSEDQEKANGTNVNMRAMCPVCKRLFRDPKLLPCLHTFCSDCIAQLEPFSRCPSRDGARGSEGSVTATILCPECDSEVELPASGPAGLSTDHLALDEVFLETLVTGGPLPCDLCGEGDAESRCEMCAINLCEFCCQAHRRQKRTAAHSLQALTELKSRGRLCRPVLCSLHPGQELRLFCPPCDLPVCGECASTLHRDHGCCPTRDVILRHGDRIRDLVSVQLRPRLERLEESLLKVNESQELLTSRVEEVAKEVRAFARGYASAVEAHCVSLLQRLEELHIQRRNQLHVQRATLAQALLDVRGGVEFAERLLSCGSEAEILSAKAVTVQRLSSLSESSYEPPPPAAGADHASTICFLPSEPAGHVDGYPVVGIIHGKTVDPGRCTVEGEGLQQCIVGHRGLFTLVCRDCGGEQLSRGGEHVVVSIAHREKPNWSVHACYERGKHKNILTVFVLCVSTSMASVLDNGDGTYVVSYSPEEPGPYSVWVCVRTQHVKGSPFSLNVKRKLRRHSGTFHCCSFCSSGGSKEARCGCLGTMPGGFKGCGHGHQGHPGKHHWSCCGSTAERSECLPQSVRDAVSARGHLRTVEL